MHGRLKVRTTEEQKLLKQKEQQKKLSYYRSGMKVILESRKSGSYSTESLAICAQILIVNPDIYTLWNCRKEAVLMEIEREKDDDNITEFLEYEIKLTEQCLLANPKSYSSWHHRYWILDHHPRPNWHKEFDLCTKYLTFDERNFHCWDYRRLILKKINASLIEELKFSTDRININFSNYSSWHYRSTLHHLNEENISEELNLIQNALFTDPSDSSAWFYLKWILSNPIVNMQHKLDLQKTLNQLLELEPECRWILIAKCWLNECLGSNTIEDKTKIYQKLEDLDRLRKGMYLDQLGTVEN